MDAYMVMLLAVYAHPPIHGFGVHKTGVYMSLEAAERAINNSVIAQPSVSRSFYQMFKITIEAPLDNKVIAIS